jgi:PKHD-type hydroxylase
MAYGNHLDSAFERETRTDFAFTLSLSEPETYSGGELVIRSDSSPIVVKPRAGSLVLYPAGTIHCVRPVTSGTRFAAISWVQSRIREQERRQLYAELDGLVAWADTIAPGSLEALRLRKVLMDLSRMWWNA